MASTSAVSRSPYSTTHPVLVVNSLADPKPSQQTTPPLTPPAGNRKDSLLDFNDLTLSQFAVSQDEEPLVAVLGCGYVGTNLIGEFRGHYNVLGFDISLKQIEIAKGVHGGEGSRASFTVAPEDLSKATHFLVSVPTLLLEDKSIDTSYVRSALELISKHARQGSTIVIESSVAVGMTRQLVGPLAKERGFFAGMSPERVDPGRTDPPMHAIPKVVSGLDDVVPGSLSAISRLYSRVFDTIFPVSKPEVAEMMKLYENCQRMVCIAYANEMADACVPHGIDPWEVCRAASTKPFGYMPFTPSLGVGGHCIPVNPYYLLSNSDFPLLKNATEKMWQRPAAVGQKALDALFNAQNEEDVLLRPSVPHIDSGIDVTFDAADEKFHTKKPDGADDHDKFSETTAVQSRRSSVDSASTLSSRARVLVVGMGFKPGQSVLSNSPGVQLTQSLADSGRADVMFADPLVKQSAIPLIPRLDDESWNKHMLETFDMIIVAIKQTGVDLSILEELEGVKVQKWYA
ncbi:hypothetical protein JX265_009159 [Neoarthrinium moseri]|uniref:Nucleotide sugar dehydrogenase n=1 Tax=Neoarthrinium moseri TaxID=1658444 RepID=A0A9P9WGP4_9PEZI|nr:hypothetical protein JX265_009159 [Neoarthrinium moseri]